jgi:hypothetical protein
MRATLLGHACWLLETKAGYFLTDPVFGDPFEEGTVTSCPRRTVDVAQLPALRGLLVSHRHLDHFDMASLAQLDPTVPVFCPPDPFLHYGLQRLGFRVIHPLEPFVAHHIDDVLLLPTPSLNRDVLECGMVVQDATGTLFNQVDTFLAAEVIQRLRHEVGSVDVHLAMYASQNFHFFESQRQQTALLHGINLHTVRSLGADCVIPAAAGFRFVDTLGWLNSHVFPISQTRFVQDLQRLTPTQRVEVLWPGDTLDLHQGQVQVERQSAACVHVLEDDTHLLAYDATAPIPPLVDLNPAGYGLQGLHEFAQGVVAVGLPQHLARGLATGDALVGQYQRYGVTYQVEVVFPDGPPCVWTYRFDPQHPTLQRVTETTVPEVRKSIAASALVDWCLGRRSYFAVRTQSRRSVQVYDVAQTAQGVMAQDVELPDLLTHYIIHDMPGAERRGRDWLDWQIAHLSP